MEERERKEREAEAWAAQQSGAATAALPSASASLGDGSGTSVWGAELADTLPAMEQHGRRFNELMYTLLHAEAEEARSGPRNVLLQAHTCPVCPSSVTQAELHHMHGLVSAAEADAARQFEATLAARQQLQRSAGPAAPGTSPRAAAGRLNPNAVAWQPARAPPPRSPGVWGQQQQQQPSLKSYMSAAPAPLGHQQADLAERSRLISERVGMVFQSLTPHVCLPGHRDSCASFRAFLNAYHNVICTVLHEALAAEAHLNRSWQAVLQQRQELGAAALYDEDTGYEHSALRFQLDSARSELQQTVEAVASERAWMAMFPVGPCFEALLGPARGSAWPTEVKALCTGLANA